MRACNAPIATVTMQSTHFLHTSMVFIHTVHDVSAHKLYSADRAIRAAPHKENRPETPESLHHPENVQTGATCEQNHVGILGYC